MSVFTTKIAAESRRLRNAAKRAQRRVALLKRREVREVYDVFPMRLRRHVDVTASDYSDTVRFSITLRDLDSFKDKQLMDTLEGFADWRAHTTDWPDATPNRDYIFRKQIDDLALEVFIWAYVKADSPLCRVVVTGVTEEVVRKEIKQIICA